MAVICPSSFSSPPVKVVEDSIGLVCCRLGELVGWAAREEREELFLGAACDLCSLFCFAALVLLVLLVLRGSLSLWFLVSDHASCTNFLRHINSFPLVLLDAFSSRFFNTNVLFLYTLYSSFFFWCLVQSGLFLFLKLAFLCYSYCPRWRI